MSKGSGGIYFERTIYQSTAFLSLSKNGMKVLIALLDSRRLNPTYGRKLGKGLKDDRRFIDLDRIKLPYVRLRDSYGMNNEGSRKAFDELLEKGFIRITHEGGLGKHDQSTYELIDDYLTWSPGTVFRSRTRDVHRGFQGRCLGAMSLAEKQISHRKPDPYAHRKPDPYAIVRVRFPDPNQNGEIDAVA